MEIVFLGTSGVQPTKDRNPQSILIRHNNENILIDCGEGTQRQLKKIDISPTKITKILISHWHGDHILGLPGMLITMGASEYSKTLEIYGPKGTKKFIKNLFKAFVTKTKIKLKIKEIKKEGTFLETKELMLSSVFLNHSVTCIGYIIKEKDKRKMKTTYLKKFGLIRDPILGNLQKGKNITYKGHKILVKNATTLVPGKKVSVISDTSYLKKIINVVKNSDILITESTFTSDLKEKAKQYKHLTAAEAAKIAKQSNSKKLILTHFGKRYNTPTPLVTEAKKIFKNTIGAKDFKTISL
jgi:ribonuclease Z